MDNPEYAKAARRCIYWSNQQEKNKKIVDNKQKMLDELKQ